MKLAQTKTKISQVYLIILLALSVVQSTFLSITLHNAWLAPVKGRVIDENMWRFGRPYVGTGGINKIIITFAGHLQVEPRH